MRRTQTVVLIATFDEAGQWEAIIDVQGGGYDTTVRTAFEVEEEAITPAIGDKAPAVDTPTVDDVDELSEITTDSDPSRPFYERDLC